MPSIAVNKKAKANYVLMDTYEAGLVLTGAEVKAAKEGDARLTGAYVTIARGEVWLMGGHIGRYKPAGTQEFYEPGHKRKLLLHKRQIQELIGKTQQKGLTLVPVELYTKAGKIKLSFALARGKKARDKREDIKKRELDRSTHRALKNDLQV